MLGTNVCQVHGGMAPQVRAAAARRLQAADITPERTLLEIARIAYGKLPDLYDADGNMKAFADMTEDERSLVAACEVIVKNAEAGDGHTDRVLKLRAWDRTKALEMLAKHFALLTDVKINYDGGEISDKLAAGRERARQESEHVH
jgi:hypothetical protein